MAGTIPAGTGVVELVVDQRAVEAGLARLGTLIEKETKEIEGKAKSSIGAALGKGVADVAKVVAGVAVAAGGAAAAIGALVVKTGQQAEAMTNAAQATGMTVEQLSGLKLAAESSGASFEDVLTGVKQLSNVVADAASGGAKASAEFAALGVAVKGADGAIRPVNAILRDVSDALAGMEDGAGKAAIANDLLGRGWQKLLPVFNGGAAALDAYTDAAKRAGGFTTETAAAAAALDDKFDSLEAKVKGVGTQIGIAFVPAVTELVDKLDAWVVANEDIIKQDIEGTVRTLVDLAKDLWPAFRDAATWVGNFVSAAAKMSGLSDTTREVIDAIREIAELGDWSKKIDAGLTAEEEAFRDTNTAIEEARARLADYSAERDMLNKRIESGISTGAADTDRVKALDGLIKQSQTTVEGFTAQLPKYQAALAATWKSSAQAFIEQSAGAKALAQELGDAADAEILGAQKVGAAHKASAEEVLAAAAAADSAAKAQEKEAKAAETLAEKLDAIDVKRLGEDAKAAADLLKDASPDNLVPAYVRAMDAITAQFDREIEAARRAATAVGTSAADEARIEAEINGRRISDMTAVTATFQDGAVKQSEALRKIAAGWKELDATKIDDTLAALDRAFADGKISSADAYAQSVQLVGKKYEILKQVARDEATSTEEGDLRVAQLERERGLAVDDLGRRYKTLAEIIDQSITDAARSISRSLSDLVVDDAFKGNFDDIGRQAGEILVGGIADVVKDTLAEVLFSPIQTALKGVIGGVFSTLGEGLGAILPASVTTALGIVPAAAAPAAATAGVAVGEATGGGISTGLASVLSSPAALAGGVGAGAALLGLGVADLIKGNVNRGMEKFAIALPFIGVPALLLSKLFGLGELSSEEKFRADVSNAVSRGLGDPKVLAIIEEAGKKSGIIFDTAMARQLVDSEATRKAIAGVFNAADLPIVKNPPSDQFVKALLPNEDALTQGISRELAQAFARATVDVSGIKDAGKAANVIDQATNRILLLGQQSGKTGADLLQFYQDLTDSAGAADALALSLGSINDKLQQTTSGKNAIQQIKDVLTGQGITVPQGFDNLDQIETAASVGGVSMERFGQIVSTVLADLPPKERAAIEPFLDGLKNVTGEAGVAAAAIEDAFQSAAGKSQASVDQVIAAVQNLAKQGPLTENQLKIANEQLQQAFQNTKNAMVENGSVGAEELAALFRQWNEANAELGANVSDDTKAQFSGLLDQLSILTGLTGDQLRKIADDFASGTVTADTLAATIAEMGGNVEVSATAAQTLADGLKTVGAEGGAVLDPMTKLRDLLAGFGTEGVAAITDTGLALQGTAPFADDLNTALAYIRDAAIPDFRDLATQVKTTGDGTIKPQADDWKGGIDDVTGAVGALIGELDRIPNEIEVNVTLTGDEVPTFHSGGVVPGRPGQEVMARVLAGEIILPRGASRTDVVGPAFADLAAGDDGPQSGARPGYVVAEVPEDLIGRIAVVKVAEAHQRGVIVQGKNGRYRLHKGWGGRR